MMPQTPTASCLRKKPAGAQIQDNCFLHDQYVKLKFISFYRCTSSVTTVTSITYGRSIYGSSWEQHIDLRKLNSVIPAGTMFPFGLLVTSSKITLESNQEKHIRSHQTDADHRQILCKRDVTFPPQLCTTGCSFSSYFCYFFWSCFYF